MIIILNILVVIYKSGGVCERTKHVYAIILFVMIYLLRWYWERINNRHKTRVVYLYVEEEIWVLSDYLSYEFKIIIIN